jgi:hypothetical protein
MSADNIDWGDGGMHADDFTARINGYCLRTEQMDTNNWWWCTYPPEHTEEDRIEGNERTEKEAKQKSIEAYRLFLSKFNGQSMRK